MRPDPPEEQIAMWRPAAGVMCIRGTTNRYAVEPNGETVVGIVTGGAMLARRRGQRHILRAGEACIWTPRRGMPDRRTAGGAGPLG